MNLTAGGRTTLQEKAKQQLRDARGRFVPDQRRNAAADVDVTALEGGLDNKNTSQQHRTKRLNFNALKNKVTALVTNRSNAPSDLLSAKKSKRDAKRASKQIKSDQRKQQVQNIKRYAFMRSQSAKSFSKALGGYTKWLLNFNEPARPIDPNKIRVVGDKQTSTHAMDSLVDVAKSAGIEVVPGKFSNGGLGEYSKGKKQIVLSGRQSMASLVSTMSHELCHVFDPWVKTLSSDHYDEYKWDYECVAQLASNIVCEELGVDNRERTAVYIKHWTGRTAQESINDNVMRTRAEAAAAQILLRIQQTSPKGKPRIKNHKQADLARIADSYADTAIENINAYKNRHFSKQKIRRKDQKAADREERLEKLLK